MRLAAAVAALVHPGRRRAIRRIGLTNLAIAFPEKSEAERMAILVASYRNLGRMVAECAHLARADRRERPRDRSRPTTVRSGPTRSCRTSQAQGVLILTGHFGNWELCAYAYGLLGHPVSLVHQTIKNPLVDAYVEGMRSGGGTRLFRKQEAARSVLRALKEREARRAAARSESVAARRHLRRLLRAPGQHERRSRAHRAPHRRADLSGVPGARR